MESSHVQPRRTSKLLMCALVVAYPVTVYSFLVHVVVSKRKLHVVPDCLQPGKMVSCCTCCVGQPVARKRVPLYALCWPAGRRAAVDQACKRRELRLIPGRCVRCAGGILSGV